MLLTTSLYAVKYNIEEEGKHPKTPFQPQPGLFIAQPKDKYYKNYTLKNSRKNIDNTIEDDEELEEDKQDFKDNSIVEKLVNQAETVFFMVIVCNNNTKQRSKFFFMNRILSKEKAAIKRVEKFLRCHAITSGNALLSPHVLFQVLGWLEEERQFTPIFIHTNCPLCVTCHAILLNFFKLDLPKSAKGCANSVTVDFEKECHLSQRYIKRHLTLSLANKILIPSVHLQYKSQLQKLARANEQGVKEQNHLKNAKNSLQNSYNSLKNEYERLRQSAAKRKELKAKYSEAKNRLVQKCKEEKSNLAQDKKRIEEKYLQECTKVDSNPKYHNPYGTGPYRKVYEAWEKAKKKLRKVSDKYHKAFEEVSKSQEKWENMITSPQIMDDDNVCKVEDPPKQNWEIAYDTFKSENAAYIQAFEAYNSLEEGYNDSLRMIDEKYKLENDKLDKQYIEEMNKIDESQIFAHNPALLPLNAGPLDNDNNNNVDSDDEVFDID